MSGWKKLAAASAAGGGGVDVDEVFSTFLYTGNNVGLGIDNNIAFVDGVGGGTSTAFQKADFLDKSFSETTRTQMTFSAWLWADANTSNKTFFRNGASSAAYEMQVAVDSSGNLDFKVTTGNQSKGANGFNKPFSYNQWHNILFSVNTATGAGHLYIDDTDVGISLTGITGEDIKPLLNSFGIMKGETQYTRSAGRVANVYLDYTYRNLTTTSNRRLFIDSNGGSTPPSTLSALNPVIYLPMTEDYAIGKNLGTGGDFSVTGSPEIISSGTEYLSDHGQGGMVWLKGRSGGSNTIVVDTERGSSKYLSANLTGAEATSTDYVKSFNADGFSTGNSISGNGDTYASWSFRKAPKFFDIVTYTGTGASTVRNLSHDLGCDVGCLIVKRLDSSESWYVWHKGFGDNGYMTLNSTNAKASYTGLWNNTAPTSTQFTVADDLNATGATFVAYLWAHNSSDGEFGPDEDQDIIKCGGWSSSGSQTVDLGFEPQWILLRPTGVTANWAVYDVMRGMVVDGAAQELYPNSTNTEGSGGIFGSVSPLSTGFKVTAGYNSNHIYIAIRRGSLNEPTSATDVFAIDTRSSQGFLPSWQSGFVTDMALNKASTSQGGTLKSYLYTRLRAKYEDEITATNPETLVTERDFDYMTGFGDQTSSEQYDYSWMWKRAPGYFDTVGYTGTGTVRTINHNLGVAPEMMWFKMKDSYGSWAVYHEALGATHRVLLNNSSASVANPYLLNNTSPTDSVFTLGGAFNSNANTNGQLYLAYLFSTLAGISKVGSYTGNGSSQTINCGFSAGARFILIKRTDSTSDWYFWDTVRGIVTGNDPYLRLNVQAAEVTNTDWVDPENSGFGVNGTTINASGGTYIFYAIA